MELTKPSGLVTQSVRQYALHYNTYYHKLPGLLLPFGLHLLATAVVSKAVIQKRKVINFLAILTTTDAPLVDFWFLCYEAEFLTLTPLFTWIQ